MENEKKKKKKDLHGVFQTKISALFWKQGEEQINVRTQTDDILVHVEDQLLSLSPCESIKKLDRTQLTLKPH